MLFEELGFRYIGPVDGHNIPQLRKYLAMVKDVEGPVLLHVVTEKGHGFQPAADDPVYFHTPAPFTLRRGRHRVVQEELVEGLHRRGQPGDRRADASQPARHGDDRRDVPGQQAGDGPRRLSRSVLRHRHLRIARRGLRRRARPRPGCGRSSTSTARSCSAATTRSSRKWRCRTCRSRSCSIAPGLTGPDGPTHHGVFDLGYMRLFPNMVVMAPGDEVDIAGHARLRA